MTLKSITEIKLLLRIAKQKSLILILQLTSLIEEDFSSLVISQNQNNQIVALVLIKVNQSVDKAIILKTCL